MEVDERDEIIKRVVLLKHLHNFAARHFMSIFTSLSVICVLIQTISAAFMFYGFSESSSGLDIAVAVLDLTGACISAVVLFIKPGLKGEQHVARKENLQRLVSHLNMNTISMESAHQQLSEILNDKTSLVPNTAIERLRKYCLTNKISHEKFMIDDV